MIISFVEYAPEEAPPVSPVGDSFQSPKVQPSPLSVNGSPSEPSKDKLDIASENVFVSVVSASTVTVLDTTS